MPTTKPSLPWGLWAIWTLLAVAIVAALVIALAAEEDAAHLTALQWASLVIGLAPLIGAQMALGSPRAAGRTRAWLAQARYPLLCTAGGITALYLLSGLLARGFDPYAAAIFGFGAFAALGTLRQIEKGKSGLTWADAALWLLIWIPCPGHRPHPDGLDLAVFVSVTTPNFGSLKGVLLSEHSFKK